MTGRQALLISLFVVTAWPGSAQGRVADHTIPGLPGVKISADNHWLTWTEHGQFRRQVNHAYHALFTPNDPQYPLQWNFTAINVATAWDQDQTAPLYGGDAKVVVAIVDTGVSYENNAGYLQAPDLNNTAIWANPNDPVDGVDNDGNGFVDDIHGWDFVNNDAHPNDDHGHGTHIAGTIAGTTNNSLATAGIAFNSTIMPLKALNNTGNGSTASITAAINYAVSKGADIINLSLGGNTPDDLLHRAIQAAVAEGVVVVAASGNDGDASVNYPAQYDETIAVGATQYDNTRPSYSDVGSQVDLAAPGGNLNVDQNSDGQPDGILQQTCSDGSCSAFNLFFYAGTSQAAAHVSATAALLEACGVPGASVRTVMESTATDLGSPGRDSEFGAGLINANTALQAGYCQSSGLASPSSISAQASATATRVLIANHPYPYTQPQFQWTGPLGSSYHVTWGKVGQTGQTTTQTNTSFIPASLTSEGSYRLRVVAIDNLDRQSNPQTFTYRFRRAVWLAGQTSNTLGIRLYSNFTFVRAWPAGLGSAVTQVVGGDIDLVGTARVLVTGLYGGRSVKVKTTRGADVLNLTPFGTNYNGSIDMAILHDAQTATYVMSSRSTGASLAWLNTSGRVSRRQTIYATYRGGLELGSGDLDGDGHDELIVAMSRGHEVRVYDRSGTRLATFSPLGKTFTGGWSVTTADIDGDGHAEIVLTPRSTTGSNPVFMTTLKGVVKKSWRVRFTGYSGGLALKGVDLTGDGVDELLAMTTSGRLHLLELSTSGQVLKDIHPLSDGRGGSLGGWQ